jgi:dolichyl-diphosphooligosaccharide--protein glycosyltransferase/undecaprenyl-diphosphooligosaccharide--protein glycosyltransferase
MKNISIGIIITLIITIGIPMLFGYQFTPDKISSDAFFYGTGIKEYFEHTNNYPRIPGLESGMVALGILVHKLTGLSYENILLFIPPIISGLIVIPIILISQIYNKSNYGLMTALLASTAIPYFIRTTTGRFDTDIIILLIPLFTIYFILKGLENYKYLFLASISIFINLYFYKQSMIINGLVIISFLILTVKNKELLLKGLFLLLLGLSYKLFYTYGIYYYFLILMITYYIYKSKKYILLYTLAGISILLITNDFSTYIINKMDLYIKGDLHTGLHFTNPFIYIDELKKYSIIETMNKSALYFPIFIISIIGYIMLVMKEIRFILFLPFLIIGSLAFTTGYRFSLYLVPVLSIGLVYILYLLDKKKKGISKILFIFVLLGNIGFILFKVFLSETPTNNPSFKEEIKDIKSFKAKNAYVISWWSDGYKLWFYTNASTIADGGNNKNDTYFVSRILSTDSDLLAYNLSKKVVAELETLDEIPSDILSKRLLRKNPEKMLNNLKLKKEDINCSSDIYLYFPKKQIGLIDKIKAYSTLNLETGEGNISKSRIDYFRKSKTIGTTLILDKDLTIDLSESKYYIYKNHKKFEPIGQFDVVEFKDNLSNIRSVTFDKNIDLHLVFFKGVNVFLLVDNSLFNSRMFQMGMLRKYNKDLFEIAKSSIFSIFYRLKK